MSWTVLDEASPTARTAHQCHDCFRRIEPGEQYRRVRAVGDDGPVTYKSCEHCTAVLENIWARDPDAAYYRDEGIVLQEYIDACARDGLLQRQYENQWAGVSVAEIALPFGPGPVVGEQQQ